jgi:PAS domain S-box-containing protein
MATAQDEALEKLARLQRKLERETRARQEAEKLLEAKSSELYDAYTKLQTETERGRLLTTAIESSSDGVAITDPDGSFSFMNLAHAEMFNYKIEELLGKPWSVLYDAPELERFNRTIMPQFAEQGHWRGETTGVAKGGQSIIQEVVLTALPNGGLVCATRDITARRNLQIRARQIEERLQKAENEAALFTLGNAVAHDFNNLIGAISGYSMLIQRASMPESDITNYAAKIESAADQASGVIRSLERERSNDIETIETVDLAALFQTGLSIAEAIRPPGILIDADLPDSAMVRANEVLLSRCLLNVVKNAFEAMGSSGQLRIRIEPSMPSLNYTPACRISLGAPIENQNWFVEISDSGPGIEQDKLERIFDPFFTSKSHDRGSGLGLMSLASLVEKEMAHVEVLSKVGHGTTFRLSFSGEHNKPITPKPVTEREPIDPSKPHVLVVEDDTMMAEIIAEMLKDFGYSYDLCHDPRDAQDLLENKDYHLDVLLTDMTMPHIMGKRLAAIAKAARADLPVLVVSGQAAFIRPDSNFHTVLRKPVSEVALRNALELATATPKPAR